MGFSARETCVRQLHVTPQRVVQPSWGVRHLMFEAAKVGTRGMQTLDRKSVV